jgi:hypothetical protein
MSQLQEDVNKMRKEAYVAKIRAEAAEAAAIKAAAAYAVASFSAVDPLIFAIRKGEKITGDTTAIIGPCWGPDFSEVLLEVSGLEVIANQRKKLESK